MFKMNPRLWNTCWWDSGSSHSPWRQGVVLSLCSNQSFCTFASTCRWVYFSCKENSRTRHSAHVSSAYCSVLHWKAYAWCPWGTDIARGNHQLIVREMKGEVLYVCFFFSFIFFSFPQTTAKGFLSFCTSICGGLLDFKAPLLYLFFVACLERWCEQTENTYFLTYLAASLEERICPLIFWECEMLECFLSLKVYLVF